MGSYTVLTTVAVIYRDLAVLQPIAEFWQSGVLLPNDVKVAQGVAYHLADVLLTELAGVCENATPSPGPAVAALLEPFVQALATTHDKPLVHCMR